MIWRICQLAGVLAGGSVSGIISCKAVFDYDTSGHFVIAFCSAWISLACLACAYEIGEWLVSGR